MEQVWQQYHQHLRAWLRSKIANPADVEDVLQEVMLKTHQKLATLESRDKLKPWLFQLTHNTVIDFYRKRGKRLPEAEDLWYGAAEPEDVSQQLSACLLPFIASLPQSTAHLLRAIELEGQSQQAYAQVAGIPYSTLKSRVRRGRLQLRALFEQCCHLHFDQQGRLHDFALKQPACQRC